MNPRRATRPLLALLTATTTAFTLAACGGGGSSDGATTTPTSTATQDAAQQSPSPQGRESGGGVSGQIVQVGDQLMQVRDDDGQTSVTWTDETTVQVTTTVDQSAVTVGSCVTAMTGGMRLPSDDDEIAGDDVATQPTDEDPAATTVTISQPVDGTCPAGPGGAFGPGGGVPGDLPSDLPTDLPLPDGMPTDMPRPGGREPGDLPTGAPDGMPRGGFGGVTAGVVTAVGGTTITVETTAQDGTTSSATVTVDDGTTFTTTTAGAASAFVVGQCADVRGTADDSGKVAATSVVVSSPGDDGCATGFAGRGPGGMWPGQGGQQSGQQSGGQSGEQGSDD
ncbi:hypothetical protein [Cellulomonas persica]|uniref:DUF5666 domain-containing protein n=1 Tax=Cellulomonas persica TaxID=76861 RepID=A0A510UWK3_9CELL|nr:hypothetical protein [Cellulomonas persica]GEK17460.1 hypothetical protein CPE01_11930 [Cellulomonas persica]